ncbi:gp58-like family protein [Enterococcus sp. AZ109]|uniref:gp58-like family protein n=1 Tax=Enterococcus sp. AZ109 TaxID=2774634 RepID=UPI003F287F77
MLKTTEEFTAAMRTDTRKIHAKVEINGAVYSERKIKKISGDLGILSGSSFLVGSTYSNSAKIVFDSILESIDYDQEVKVYLGIEVDHWEEPNEQLQYVSMGKFYIEDFYRNRNSLETTIELSDGFLYMEKPYDSKLSYPAEMRRVALEICNQAGIEVDEVNFSRLSEQKIDKIEGVTCREAIGYIAQFHSGFAHFNREGKFEIRNLLTTNYEITDSDYLLKGLEVKEKPYSTDGIRVKARRTDNSEEKVFTAGATVGNVVELNNPVMTQSLLDEIWRKVSPISFIPFEMQWRGNPQLEVGDWISITDTEERRFHVPQLLMSFDYNGGLKMKSSAQTTSGSSSTYKYRGSINQVIQFLEEQIAANGVNRIFHGAAEPSNPIEGDIWFKPNGPYIEMWIYEETGEDISNWVLKLSTEPSKELINKIDEAKKEAEKAISDANNVRVIAEDAVARADNSAQAAEDARKIGEQAAGNAKQAQDSANAALEDAKKAQETGNAALEDAKQAQVTGNAALEDAKKALEDISGVDSKLTTEITRIDGALSSKIEQATFNKLEGTVTNQGTLISQNAKEIATKASQTSVDTVTGKVNTHETLISQNAAEIATKASIKDVDTISGKVDTHETKISQNAKEIATKASQTSVNTLTGKVNTHETQISQNAKEISTKASQTTVDKIEGTVNTHETRLIQNEKEIQLKASQLSVDTINGKVDSHETRLTQNESEIKLKASQSNVDTISGKVTSIETEVSTIAGNFSVLNTKVEGHTSKIGTLESNYSGLNSTIAVLQEDVLGKVDTLQFSNLSQRVDSIQLTVDDKADKAQLTVLSDQISLVVSDVEGNKNSIHVLQNDINLAVKKGDIINQINVSSESILIAGNKVQITGQTYIENAAIKSAAIDSLEANKLTVGSTLNAALINVINLNANNLTAGEITGLTIRSSNGNSFWDLTTGQIVLKKGGIESPYLTLNLDSSEMLFHRRSGLYTAVNDYGFYAYKVRPEDGYNINITDAIYAYIGANQYGIRGALVDTSSFSVALWEKYGTGSQVMQRGTLSYSTSGFSATYSAPMVAGSSLTDSFGLNLQKDQFRVYIARSGDIQFETSVSGSGSIRFYHGLSAYLNSDSTYLTVYNNFRVTGTKNAIHPTRDGVRATPAYETTESYLGDIGRNYTREDCEVWIPVEQLFSDTVNTDIAYEVFLQAYDDARFWVADFKPDKFLIKSDMPLARFAWELKAKRRGYENERLVEAGLSNKEIEDAWHRP